MRRLCSFLLVLCPVMLGACIGGVDSGAGDAPGVDAGPPSETDFDRAMMQTAAMYKSFMKIDRHPYTSALGAFQINVYVDGDVKDYRTAQPDTMDPNPPIAAGTVIVREILDAQGAVSKLTLMAKGPSGYDPTIGDWWFGEADPQGQPLIGDDGSPRLGRLADCHTCHLPRAMQDYIFGVPKADQH